MQGYFITGTDTEVGKTYVTCLLAKYFAAQGKKVNVSKPISAGCDTEFDGKMVNEDAYQLMRSVYNQQTIEQINPLAFLRPIAPHIAAKEEGVTLSIDDVKNKAIEGIDTSKDVTLVEGAGGWLVPIDRLTTFADLAVAFNYPVILVVGMRLGCINHALLTHASILQHQLPFAGWIANCLEPDMPYLEENIETLTEKLGNPIAVVSRDQKLLRLDKELTNLSVIYQ